MGTFVFLKTSLSVLWNVRGGLTGGLDLPPSIIFFLNPPTTIAPNSLFCCANPLFPASTLLGFFSARYLLKPTSESD